MSKAVPNSPPDSPSAVVHSPLQVVLGGEQGLVAVHVSAASFITFNRQMNESLAAIEAEFHDESAPFLTTDWATKLDFGR